MVIVSCSGKFHAFNLAEQLARHGQLSRFYTRYAYQRNTVLRRFVSRVDKEDVPTDRIRTITPLAVAAKLSLTSDYTNSHLYDKWVASQLRRQADNYQVLIGWSGMSLHSIREANQAGKLTIVERGSSHIVYQNTILRDEFARQGIAFAIDPRTIEKECQEYMEADYISIPSQFVKRTFLEQGIPEQKLLVNPYGAGCGFQVIGNHKRNDSQPFTILYLGTLNVRKGLIYLFEALRRLSIPEEQYAVWFIGRVSEEVQPMIPLYQQTNWVFWGHIDHYELPQLIARADVGIQPSIEEGLSMVVPQMLSAGVPVIATEHTGAADLITEGENGFVVPIRSPEAIADKLTYLHTSPTHLRAMQQRAAAQQREQSWEEYGNRYVCSIDALLANADN
jgi:glycosyltransferase involved in cell wall biosynthesis